MNKEEIQKALAQVKAQPTRKFSQSYELVINLKNLVIKQNPLDFVITLHYTKGKQIKVAAFVGTQSQEQAKQYCDLVISESDFEKYSDKKELKKLADSYDYFIAQANLMQVVAKTFGKVLGIKGKMPNPKLGCVVPPNANLEPLVKQLNLAVRMQAKKATNLQCMVGKENQPDVEIVDNILTVYTMTLKQLPNEIQNVKSVILKTTMGKPVKI